MVWRGRNLTRTCVYQLQGCMHEFKSWYTNSRAEGGRKTLRVRRICKYRIVSIAKGSIRLRAKNRSPYYRSERYRLRVGRFWRTRSSDCWNEKGREGESLSRTEMIRNRIVTKFEWWDLVRDSSPRRSVEVRRFFFFFMKSKRNVLIDWSPPPRPGCAAEWSAAVDERRRTVADEATAY